MSEKPILKDEKLETTEIAETSVPPQIEDVLSGFMSVSMSGQSIVSSTDKIAEKLTAEHITQIIEVSSKEDERAFAAFQWRMATGIIIFVLSLVFAGLLLVLFRDSEYFVTILTAIFSFLGGMGVGKFILPHKNRG